MRRRPAGTKKTPQPVWLRLFEFGWRRPPRSAAAACGIKKPEGPRLQGATQKKPPS